MGPPKGSSTDIGGAPSRWRLLLRWFQPGLGVKRWLIVMVAATALIGLGLAIFLLEVYRANPDSPWLALLAMRALPRWLRALTLAMAGVAALAYAIVRLNRSLLAPYLRPGKPVVEAVAEHRRLGKGPKIVAIGGGTGLSTLLRGLKRHTGNLSALVTVSDDGGSSGRLREALGLPAPGDLRNCLAALSDDEDLLTQLFQYRFLEGHELSGHSFGNLFIAALAGVTGSFDRGILETGRVLAIRGEVLPTTLENVALLADKTPMLDAHAVRVEGESRIPTLPGRIRRVHLEPHDVPAYPGAIRALLQADLIVIGPGSLYTSVLPNLLIPEIRQAIRASRAFKVLVCNVATQPGETDGYSAYDHLQAMDVHVGPQMADVILLSRPGPGRPPEGSTWVGEEARPLSLPSVVVDDLTDPDRPGCHDSRRLAGALVQMLEERTGPLESSRRDGQRSNDNGAGGEE
ncbi:MAG: gluconeogenesis factor YvcK family protein [Anaerolineales bacterium]